MTDIALLAASPEPTGQGERIEAMDALRGFALLGVLIINMFTFMGPMARLFEPWASMRWMQFLVLALVQGKFYCLFSLLFGMGFSVQLERMQARGIEGTALYRRRLVVLLLIGLVQGLLVWEGDILLPYALLGFVLLAFRRRHERIWLGLAVALLLYSTVQVLIEAAHVSLQALPPEDSHLEAIRAYAQGPYALLLETRVGLLLRNYLSAVLGVGPQILAMFFMGAWAGRKRLLTDRAAHRTLMRQLAGWGLGLGIPVNALYAVWLMKAGPTVAGRVLLLRAHALFLLGGPLLTIGLASAFVLVMEHVRALGRLAPMGRMALTHYLTHSLVFATLFSFVGLGNYGKVSILWAPPLAIGTWLAQAWLSPLWFRRFRMGPMEWLWRALTYGKAPAFRSENT
jgi:uncharacterized protein